MRQPHLLKFKELMSNDLSVKQNSLRDRSKCFSKIYKKPNKEKEKPSAILKVPWLTQAYLNHKELIKTIDSITLINHKKQVMSTNRSRIWNHNLVTEIQQKTMNPLMLCTHQFPWWKLAKTDKYFRILLWHKWN